MNNLYRDLAPVTEAAWAEIELRRRGRSSDTSPGAGWSMSVIPGARHRGGQHRPADRC